MKTAEWKIVSFPLGLDAITYNPASQSVDVQIEVPGDRRKRLNGLADYESDFWRICGNMASAGFQGDICYEAIGWQDQAG